MKFNVLNRKVHYWLSAIVALPILIVIVSGLFLQLKKDVAWIQPSTVKGTGETPELSFDRILEAAKSVEEAEVKSWDDVDRLDVRPSKGIVKVRANNRWEVQVDLKTGEVLQVAFRRSDLIESIHDGSFFHDYVKLWLFFPSAMVLFVLWVTGIYMFVLPYWVKSKRKKAK